MGKQSRRSAGTVTAVPTSPTPAPAPAASERPKGLLAQVPGPTKDGAHWLQLDLWEKVVLMFLCLTCTMKLMGEYIPGVSVLMEGELMGCVPITPLGKRPTQRVPLPAQLPPTLTPAELPFYRRHIGSAVSVFGMAGLSYSFFAPGQHLDRIVRGPTPCVLIYK